MASSIAKAEQGVQRAAQRVTESAESCGSLAEVEAELWSAVLALGRAVIALWLARRAARPRPSRYERQGRQYALDTRSPRHREVGTRFGKVGFLSPVGRPVGGRAACDLPVDRELGLCGSFSLGTVMAITKLCAQMAFGSARATFRDFHEWMPSPRATLRMVDGVGGEAMGFLEACPAPDEDGEILVIEVDGRGAPMIKSAEYERRCCPKRRAKTGTGRHRRRARRQERPKVRRTKGKKSKNAKVAVVGVIYTLRKTRSGLEGPINKRIVATFDSHDALFVRLRKLADKRGYGDKRTIFLADGSDHIWRAQQKYFRDAEPCVDWFHIVEKLWAAGECLHHEGSAELKAWVVEQTRNLRHGRVGAVLTTLGAALAATPKTGPGNKGKRKRLGAILNHLTRQRHRLRYARFRRDDLPIGSGVVEGAVRNLVAMRLDGPGMRWGRSRSELVLHLRCIVLNGQWAEFAAYVARRGLTLAAQPVPARTHDAVSCDAREAA
jgi:hypothetical protein